MKPLLPLLALAAAACASTAPHTVPSALANTALAVGAAAESRAAGGCVAQCVGGTVCNPRTGWCEPLTQVCIGAEAETPACQHQRAPLSTSQPAPPLPGLRGFPVGVSPATGSVPPPPQHTPSIEGR